MTTVTGFTADRMRAIEDASVIDGEVDENGHLILTKFDGSEIDAGSVIGPMGPIGSDIAIASAYILEVGMVGQTRAGRNYSNSDFTALGLSAPIALYSLNTVSDTSGNGRNLTNKGAVGFAPGILAAAASSAQFLGSSAQALYRADTGAGDPFRFRTGSIGFWFKSSRRQMNQFIVSKRSLALGQYGWWFKIQSEEVEFGYSSTGSDENVIDTNTVGLADGQWHFIVGVFDGSHQRLYLDGVLDASAPRNSLIFASSAPLNIGGANADGSTVAELPLFGGVDNVFITSEPLSAHQVRDLYSYKLAHALGEVPARVSIKVYPHRRGGALTVDTFPVAPLRLFNFSAGTLLNEGSDGSGSLTNEGGAISQPGPDGTKDNAFFFSGAQRLKSTDAGLPSALQPVSFGCWIKTGGTGSGPNYIMTWGAVNGTNDLRLVTANGKIVVGSGPSSSIESAYVADGLWYFVVVVLDNAALDGVKGKIYVNGNLVATMTTLNTVVLGGTDKFCIGASLTNSNPFTGSIDGVFVSGQALSLDTIVALYNLNVKTFAPYLVNEADHVTALALSHILVDLNSLDSSDTVEISAAGI